MKNEQYIPNVVSTGDCFCLTIDDVANEDLARRYARALLDCSLLPLPDQYWTSGSKAKRKRSIRRDPYLLRHRKIPIQPEEKKKIGIQRDEKKKIGIPPDQKKKIGFPPDQKKKIGFPPVEMKKIGIPPNEKKKIGIPPDETKKIVIPPVEMKKIGIPLDDRKEIGIPREEMKKKIGIPPEEKKKLGIPPPEKKKLLIPPEENKKLVISSEEKKIGIPPPKEMKKKIRIPRKKVLPPRIQLNCNNNTGYGVMDKESGLEDANFALERYNKANPGHEYELVEVIGGISMRMQYAHLNFIGKPVDQSSDDEAMLFFAEVRGSALYACHELTICQTCCILGPIGTATGLGGCETACAVYANGRHRIHHPEDGFTKKCAWWTQFHRSKDRFTKKCA